MCNDNMIKSIDKFFPKSFFFVLLISLFFYLSFLSRTLTNHRLTGEGRGTCYLFHDGGLHYTETSPLICRTNQGIDF